MADDPVVAQPAMQPVAVQPRLVAGQNANRPAQLLRLGAKPQKQTRQRRHVAAVDPVTAHLPGARQCHAQLPLRLAQLENNVNRGILASGRCVSVIS